MDDRLEVAASHTPTKRLVYQFIETLGITSFARYARAMEGFRLKQPHAGVVAVSPTCPERVSEDLKEMFDALLLDTVIRSVAASVKAAQRSYELRLPRLGMYFRDFTRLPACLLTARSPFLVLTRRVPSRNSVLTRT